MAKKEFKYPKYAQFFFKKNRGGITGNLGTFLLKIVAWGVGIVGNRVANFRKNGVGGITILDGRVPE